MTAAKEAPVMVHAREVRPMRFRSGVTSAELLHVVKHRAGFGDGRVEAADGQLLLHTDQSIPDGHYFFTPWPRDKPNGTSGVITVHVRGGGVSPARFPISTTGRQLLRVLREDPDFGEGSVDDLAGFCVPPSDAPLTPGVYFFLPGATFHTTSNGCAVLYGMWLGNAGLAAVATFHKVIRALKSTWSQDVNYAPWPLRCRSAAAGRHAAGHRHHGQPQQFRAARRSEVNCEVLAVGVLM